MGDGVPAQRLTDTERCVLEWLPTVLSSADIGERLGLPELQVKATAITLYRKLGVDNRLDAVKRGVELGFLAASEDAERGRVAGRAPVDAHSYLEALGAAVFGTTSVRGADGTIVDFEFDYCNPAALDVVGRDYADIIGHRLLDLFPLSVERGLFGAFVGVVESGQPTRFEFTFTEAGVSGEFEAVVSRHRDGYVLAAHEITARVQRERELVLVRDQLQSALTSRVTIEQAKGFLAARAGTDPETAFLAIRRHARDHNKRLIDVAQSIVLGDIELGRSEGTGAS